jgi:hypothetical protein
MSRRSVFPVGVRIRARRTRERSRDRECTAGRLRGLLLDRPALTQRRPLMRLRLEGTLGSPSSRLAQRQPVGQAAQRHVGELVGKSPRKRIIAPDQCQSTDAPSAAPLFVVARFVLDRRPDRRRILAGHDLDHKSGLRRHAGSAAMRRILALEHHRPNGRDRSAHVLILFG